MMRPQTAKEAADELPPLTDEQVAQVVAALMSAQAAHLRGAK